MEMSDGELLLRLRRALDAVAADGPTAQAKALEETLRQHDATMADVARALGEVRRRRFQEIAGLAGRLDRLAGAQEDAAATADAVDRYLRGQIDGHTEEAGG